MRVAYRLRLHDLGVVRLDTVMIFKLTSIHLAVMSLSAAVTFAHSFDNQRDHSLFGHPIFYPYPRPPGPAQFGDPLPGLTTNQLADFAEGLDQFEEIQSVESGLGPIFNHVSCVACHSGPATGGASAILETRFGRTVNGVFDPLTELGGSLLQLSTIDPAC